MNPRSTLRQPRQERRSTALSTSGPGPGAPQRAKGAPLVLYRCNAFAAWLTVNACTALKLREKAPPRASRLEAELHDEGPVFRALRAHGRRLSPCLTCPGVVELRRRGLTPAPRRVATS